MTWEQASAFVQHLMGGADRVSVSMGGESMPWAAGMFALWAGRHMAAGVRWEAQEGRLVLWAHNVRHEAIPAKGGAIAGEAEPVGTGCAGRSVARPSLFLDWCALRMREVNA